MCRKVAEHGEREDYLFTLLSCLKVKLRRTRKPLLGLFRPFFLGRDDKYPPHFMTVAHILCDEMLLSNGKQHLWEVSHMLRFSRMLVTVPVTDSPVSELSTFPSMWCKALPALLPQQSQSWEVEGSVAGLQPIASAPREKRAVCLVSHSFVQTFPEISGFAHFHEFFTFASCIEDVVWTDPWIPGTKRAKAVRCASLFPPPFLFWKPPNFTQSVQLISRGKRQKQLPVMWGSVISGINAVPSFASWLWLPDQYGR